MARIKNIEAFCNVCNGVKKMELAGEVADQENKRWAKCKKCKQTMVIDLNENVKDSKVSFDGIESEDCTVYSPQKSFSVGESIYHEKLDDFGKITGKEIMSNGRSSITVEFQKLGHKKLIESLTL